MKIKKIRRKFFIINVLYLVLGVLLMDTVIKTSYQLYVKNKEKKEFMQELEVLKDKEEELNGQVSKLQDPDYIARYAREKYLYSKDGEIIIRIPE